MRLQAPSPDLRFYENLRVCSLADGAWQSGTAPLRHCLGSACADTCHGDTRGVSASAVGTPGKGALLLQA